VYRIWLGHRDRHGVLYRYGHRLGHRDLDDLDLLLLVASIAAFVASSTGPLAAPIAADASLLNRVLMLNCSSECRRSQDGGEEDGPLQHGSQLRVVQTE
jgi:hypothetical protein